MGDTASDYLVQRLHAWGIRRIYGYPAVSTGCSAL